MMNHTIRTILPFLLMYLFSSCGSMESKIDEKLMQLENKTRSLDSLVNTEVEKVMSLDSLIEKEKSKIMQLDTLIESSTSRIDSLKAKSNRIIPKVLQ